MYTYMFYMLKTREMKDFINPMQMEIVENGNFSCENILSSGHLKSLNFLKIGYIKNRPFQAFCNHSN